MIYFLADLRRSLRTDAMHRAASRGRRVLCRLLALSAFAIGLSNSSAHADKAEVAAANRPTAIVAAEKYLAEGAYSQAQAAFDAALRLGDESAAVFAGRGAARLGLGDHPGGIADLQEAIRRNPGDAGQTYQPEASVRLSAAALKHGDEQVRQMLKDRPAMAKHVAPGSRLWQWAARKFAGEDLGDTIDWDPAPPRDAGADHTPPTRAKRGSIRVRKFAAKLDEQGAAATFDECWRRAIFELHNITGAADFQRAQAAAAAGKLTEEEYVRQVCQAEYHAAQRTRAFYVRVYLPWAIGHGVKTDPRRWYTWWWGAAENVLDRFPNRDAYPWRPCARYYWRLRVEHLLEQHQYADAAEGAQQYLWQAKFADEAAYGHYLMALSCYHLGNLAPATEALNRSRQSAPPGYDNGYYADLMGRIREKGRSGR